MDRNRALEEMRSYRICRIDEIDPEGVFHIRGPIMFTPNLTDLPKHVRTRAKRHLRTNKHPLEVVALCYEDGGMSMQDALQGIRVTASARVIDLIMHTLCTLLKNICVMHTEGVFHCDIKSTNVVMRQDKVLTFRLIDFGLSFSLPPVGPFVRHHDVFRVPYGVWPPCACLLRYKCLHMFVGGHVDVLIRYLNRHARVQPFHTEAAYLVGRVYPVLDHDQFIKQLIGGGIESIHRMLLTLLDIHGIGMLLLEVCNKLMRVKSAQFPVIDSLADVAMSLLDMCGVLKQLQLGLSPLESACVTIVSKRCTFSAA